MWDSISETTRRYAREVVESTGMYGFVDIWLSELIAGWACMDETDQPVRLDFEANGKIAASVTCDDFRPDLVDYGRGGGRYGFHFNPREYLHWGLNSCRLLVHPAQDEIPFPYNPHLLLPEQPLARDVPMVLNPLSVWHGRQDPAFFRPPRSGAGQDKFAIHVIGPYNSGTTFLQSLLDLNGLPCSGEESTRVLFKHYPLPVLKRMREHYRLEDSERRIFLVMVRDPRAWIASTKVSPYEAQFASVRDEFSICIENAIALDRACGDYLGPAYAEGHAPLFAAPNIVEYWNAYYGVWYERGFELSDDVYFLRYEDLITYPAECISLLTGLVHLASPNTMTVQISSANGTYRAPGSLWSARRKLVYSENGLEGDELSFLRTRINYDLADYFGYRIGRAAPRSPAASALAEHSGGITA